MPETNTMYSIIDGISQLDLREDLTFTNSPFHETEVIFHRVQEGRVRR
jgi:hypothetical protein